MNNEQLIIKKMAPEALVKGGEAAKIKIVHC